MTRLEMESTVAELLLLQEKFRRLGTELPPDKLSLLKRLLYRLGLNKMSRTNPNRYARLTLSEPKPGISFGGEPLNEHNLHDEQGNVVGNMKIRDRGPMLHVDWIGGKGLKAGPNGLGNEAMRSIHDAIAAHYPNAQYLTGHRISGFRGKKTTGERVVVPIRRNVKMSRKYPIRYAKWDKTRKVHPLLEGFPISHALIHIANHPKSTSDQKDLAVAALKGHTEALWLLHDALQEHDHPINKAGYKWLNAADKLHLDKHTYTALTEAAARRRAEEPHADHRLWHYTPEHRAIQAAQGVTVHPDFESSPLAQSIISRVKQLSPNSTDEEVHESTLRHGHRAAMESSRRVGVPSPDEGEEKRALQSPTEKKLRGNYFHKNEVATRYKRKPNKYSLANKSNFIGSLLKVSSPEHKMFVKRTKQLARQAGAKQTKEFPALHDTPNQSVPGVALAVYGHIQPDNAHALGSWVNGLLPNSPGYAVFHARPTGPDTLYRIRMEGSGHDARAKLDRSGINSRIFVPHRKGLDVLIPDKGNQLGQLIQNFATQQKIPIESSQGHLTTVGSQDQAQARNTFRNKVATAENKMTRQESAIKYAGVLRSGKKIPSPPVPKYKGKEELPFGEPVEEEHDPLAYPEPGKGVGPINYPYRDPPPSPAPSRLPQIPKREFNLPQRPIRYNPIEEQKSKPLFSPSEYNKVHAWAHSLALKKIPEFSKFLGKKKPNEPATHKLLVKTLINAAHEMKRNGTNTHKAEVEGTDKKINISTSIQPWVDTKTTTKSVKLPKGAEPAPRIPLKDVKKLRPKKRNPKKLDRYSRRRRALQFQL